jgi:hypothetical protein
MSRLNDLANNYEKHISAPWQRNLAGAQRSIFVVYPQEDERRIRAKIVEFEARTRNAGHDWQLVDLTDMFPNWMASELYRESYFEDPSDLKLKLDTTFMEYVSQHLRGVLANDQASEQSVVAVIGGASLYGFLHISELIDKVAGDIRGRLVFFFPGHFEQGTYSLLGARSGWNYLATPITHRSGE